MADFKRSQRVAELLRQEISHIIARELKDPLIGMASVTKVTLSDDLRFAKVYVSIIGKDTSAENSLQGLDRAKRFIRSQLGSRTDLRFVPDLSFVYDKSAAYAHDIETLLNQLNQQEGDESAPTNS
ncbi:MAG: 30S ribosome-binding factor RbfA [bacterium]